MEAIFLNLINRSIAAGWLILAVLLLRILLKKAPRAVRCWLWALVGIRLVCPFSLETAFSLIPSAETIPPEILYSQEPAVESGIRTVDHALNPILSSSLAPTPGASVNPLQLILAFASLLWIAGITAMLLYGFVSCLRLRRQVSASIRLRDNLWLCDTIKSPFIFGILFPRIYLPSDMEEQQLAYVVAHEKAHLSRHDHWWKPLAFLLLSVYCFHPLCWVAYVLLGRDIELACDERVVREMAMEEKKNYASALLSCGMPRHMILACPLAFGEVGIKERVRAVLHYKKPAFWIVAAAALVCMTAAVFFLTSPKAASQDDIFGARYAVKEVLYDSPLFDFTYPPDTAPEYVFTSDLILMERGGITGSDIWISVGVFHEVHYSQAELAALFLSSDTAMEHRPGERSEHPDAVPKDLAQAKQIWRIDSTGRDTAFYLVMQTRDGEVLLAQGYDAEGNALIRRLWKLEKVTGRYDQEYLAAQVSSMCGSNVQIFAIYEADTIPGHLLAGFAKNNSRGFAVFRYDSPSDSYGCTVKGYHSFGRDALCSVTIGEDWGFDHSLTIVLSSRMDLSAVTAKAGEDIQHKSAGYVAPTMIVFDWGRLLSAEEAAAIEVHYYNSSGRELTTVSPIR